MDAGSKQKQPGHNLSITIFSDFQLGLRPSITRTANGLILWFDSAASSLLVMAAINHNHRSKPPAAEHPSCFQLSFIGIAIFLYLFDLITDAQLAVGYYQTREDWYFGLTVAFVGVTAVIISSISAWWYYDDQRKAGFPQISKSLWVDKVICCVPLLGPSLICFMWLCKDRQHANQQGAGGDLTLCIYGMICCIPFLGPVAR